MAFGEASDEERHKLAKESITILSCSDELIDLIEYLDERKIYDAMLLSLLVVDELFKFDQAAEARLLLVALVDAKRPRGVNYREFWAFHAGKWTSPAEIDEFCSSLGTGASALEARLGYNIRFVQKDPLAAIQSTVSVLTQQQASPSKDSILRQMMEKLPANADFEAIEKLFPHTESDNPTYGSIDRARRVLFTKWASKDPVTAANYVIDNLGRFNPALVEPVVEAVVGNDLESGVAWVEAFPVGIHRDYASLAAVRALAGSDAAKAKQIAGMIRDADVRKAG